jgi:hypothetical protein
MKAESPLDARINQVRRTLRSRQPLDQRIALVRSRHRAVVRKGVTQGNFSTQRES